MMSYYQRIAAFLSEYVCYEGGEAVPPNPVAIRDAIAALLQLGVFDTKAELQRAALRDYDVIIGDRFFL